MKSTPYFEEQVLRKRPYLQREWVPISVETRKGKRGM